MALFEFAAGRSELKSASPPNSSPPHSQHFAFRSLPPHSRSNLPPHPAAPFSPWQFAPAPPVNFHRDRSIAVADCLSTKRRNLSLRSRPAPHAPRHYDSAPPARRSAGRHQHGYSRERLPASAAPRANRK